MRETVVAGSGDEHAQPEANEHAQPSDESEESQAGDEDGLSGEPERIWMKTESVRGSGESREDFIQRMRPEEENRGVNE